MPETSVTDGLGGRILTASSRGEPIVKVMTLLVMPAFGYVYQLASRPTFTNISSHLYLQPSADYYSLPNDYLLALLCHRLGDAAGAYRHLSIYLSQAEIRLGLPNLVYGQCLLAYFKLKSQNCPDEALRANLIDIYGAQVADVVVSDFQDRRQAFRGMKLPACGQCLLCPTRLQCYYPRWKKLSAFMRERMQANPVQQIRLAGVFAA